MRNEQIVENMRLWEIVLNSFQLLSDLRARETKFNRGKRTDIVSSGCSSKSLCSLNGLFNALSTASTTYSFLLVDVLKKWNYEVD